MKTRINAQIIFESDRFKHWWDDEKDERPEINIKTILEIINSGVIAVEAINNVYENDPLITLLIKDATPNS